MSQLSCSLAPPLRPLWAPNAATCYVLLADLALNFLRSLISKQWQEAAGWAGSATAAALAQRAADGVAVLARLHDSYLLCRDPMVALKTGAALWGLAVLGSHLRWARAAWMQAPCAGGGRACAPRVPAWLCHHGAPCRAVSTCWPLTLPTCWASGPTCRPSPAPCSLWSLAALAFVAAFTLPAAYSRNREAVRAAYQRAVGAAASRWDALGLSRKQKARCPELPCLPSTCRSAAAARAGFPCLSCSIALPSAASPECRLCSPPSAPCRPCCWPCCWARCGCGPPGPPALWRCWWAPWRCAAT